MCKSIHPNRKQTIQFAFTPLYGKTLERSNVLVYIFVFCIYWYMALENNDGINKMSKKSNISQNGLLILEKEIHLLHQS